MSVEWRIYFGDMLMRIKFEKSKGLVLKRNFRKI